MLVNVKVTVTRKIRYAYDIDKIIFYNLYDWIFSRFTRIVYNNIRDNKSAVAILTLKTTK